MLNSKKGLSFGKPFCYNIRSVFIRKVLYVMKEKIKRLWNDRDNQRRYAKWLMHYSKPYIGKITAVTLLNLSSTVITLVMAMISKKIIDDATSGATKNSVLTFVGIYLGLIILSQVVTVVVTLASTMLGERFSFGIRKQVYEKIITSDWMSVKAYHTGDLMTRMTSDAGNIANGIIWTIPEILQLIVELILVFCLLFYYSPLLACFSLIIAPVAAICMAWLGKKLKKLTVKVQESEAAYRSFMQESMANLLIVKAFANEDYSIKRLVDLREERFSWVYKKTKLGLVSSTAMSFSFQLGYIVAFAYGAIQVAGNVITYGTMSLFLQLVNRIQSPIMQLAQQIPKLISILASAGRVIELQAIAEEEKLKENIEAKRIGITVDGLSFGYTDETVIDNASFEIRPGEFVAIVGESGIGKTTLVRLIMSFLNGSKDAIMFYNENGEKEPSNASTRKFISYVPQGNTLFSGTIRENIRMGNLEASDEEIIEALKMASGYDFVMSLDKGLDTVIGERGHGLSEGQAQRIAIARTLVRKAPFMILDEATSALDEATELKVLEGLKKLDPKPTCLIITHRRSILDYCDREIRIENKKVNEEKISK